MLIKKDCRVSIKGASNLDRTLTITASTQDVDRDGDRIMAAGWDLGNFMKNPVIPWAHQYDQPPIAKALEARVANQKLNMRIQFPSPETYPFADTIFKLYKGGYLNAFSVGFMPKRWETVERTVNGKRVKGRDYHEQELWEVSACTVPSNPNALTLAKGVGLLNARDYQRMTLEQEISRLADRARETIEDRISKAVEKAILRRGLDVALHNRGID